MRTSRRHRSTHLICLLAGAASLAIPAVSARAQENPPVILQWFECRWPDIERRMSDFFVAGYGAAWLPPISRGYVPPTAPNQNSSSAGYDTFDRFDLGRPGAQTAYGTEAYFDAMVEEFHRAN